MGWRRCKCSRRGGRCGGDDLLPTELNPGCACFIVILDYQPMGPGQVQIDDIGLVTGMPVPFIQNQFAIHGYADTVIGSSVETIDGLREGYPTAPTRREIVGR